MSIVVVQPSKRGGHGSFATRRIKQGEYITTLKGERITADEMQRRIATGQEGEDDSLQISSDTFLDLEESARLFNHSCEPNVCIRGESELFALRDIEAGEEVTYDYSTTVRAGNKYPWSMTCQCRLAQCRKVISDVLTIPKEVLQSYLTADVLPDFTKKQAQQALKT